MFVAIFPKFQSATSWFADAIKLKSRLEELLEHEKTEEKQKVDELQNILNEEKEARQKDQEEYKKAKEEAENRYTSLKQQYEELQVGVGFLHK